MSMGRGRLGGPRARVSLRARLAVAMICALIVPGSRAWAQGGSAAKRDSVPATSNTPPAAAAPTMPKVNGTELDRVVAIVNDDLVLDSDVAEEQRFQELQPIGLSGTPRGSFDRNRAIERLIDRDLILQQAQLEPGLEVADADLDKEIEGLRKDLPGCKEAGCATDAGWNRYLAAHGFTPAAFRDRWRQRMEVLSFIEERFQSGARISEADIKTYYEKEMLPEYERRGVAAPKLDVLSGRIQQVLLQRQVTALLSDWLKQLRAQGSVAVLHPGESAP